MKKSLLLIASSLLAAFAVAFTLSTYSGDVPTFAEEKTPVMTITGLIGGLFGE